MSNQGLKSMIRSTNEKPRRSVSHSGHVKSAKQGRQPAGPAPARRPRACPPPPRPRQSVGPAPARRSCTCPPAPRLQAIAGVYARAPARLPRVSPPLLRLPAALRAPARLPRVSPPRPRQPTAPASVRRPRACPPPSAPVRRARVSPPPPRQSAAPRRIHHTVIGVTPGNFVTKGLQMHRNILLNNYIYIQFS